MQISDGGGLSRKYLQLDPPPPAPPKTHAAGLVLEREEAPPQTAAERTDAAYDNYQKALQHRDQALADAPMNGRERQDIKRAEDAAVEKARQELNAAVNAEIGEKIDKNNEGVPPEYQTSDDALVTSYGNTILQRHANDPAAQGVLTESINDCRLQRKADDLIPNFYGNESPKEKLEALNRRLEGQPPEVVDRVMADPRVQKMIKEAEAWINEPYNGISAEDAKRQPSKASESSQRLVDVVSLLPPKYAAQVVGNCMPTIEKIASVPGNIAHQDAFRNMSRVVELLGPNEQGLTFTIAEAYREVFKTDYEFHRNTIGTGVGEGMSPTLALEIAKQLKTNGLKDQAANIVHGVRIGAEQLRSKVNDAYGEYAQHTKQLSWLIANYKDQLTPQQLQQAIDKYISQQPPEWQAKLKEIKATMVNNARALNESIGALQSLPNEMKQDAAGAFHQLRAIGEDQKTQQAIKFAATEDPSVFGGPKGNSAASFWVELAQNGKEFVPAYMAGKVLPELAHLNPNDPESIARANRQLDDLQKNGAKLLGVPQSEVDAAVAKLRGLVETLKTAESPEAAAKAVKQQLQDLGGLKFSNGIASMAFRTAAFGLTGAALINQTGKTLDDPSVKNIMSELAFAVGLAPDATAFATSVKLVDAKGALGQFGLGASDLGKGTAKFVGLLNIAAFAAGGFEAAQKGNIAGVLFNITGAGGTALAAFGTAAWAGPIGVAVTVISMGVIEFVNYQAEQSTNRQESDKFLQAAGISDDRLRGALVNGDPEQAQQLLQMGMTVPQIQELARYYPGLLRGEATLSNLADLQKRVGISGNALYQLLMVADGDGRAHGKGAGVRDLMNLLCNSGPQGELNNVRSKDDLIAYLEKEAQYQSKYYPEEGSADAYRRAAEWLRTHILTPDK